VKVVIVIEPDLPEESPGMMQNEFEPSVAILFLGINVRVIHDVSSLNLSPMFAESSFEKMLPSDFVPGNWQRLEMWVLGCWDSFGSVGWKEPSLKVVLVG
jgi:hypothetical protein